MPPISPMIGLQRHVVDNRIEKPFASTSSLELSLITVAVIDSFALVFTSKMKNLNCSRYPVFTCIVVALALFFTGAAIGLSIATLLLGWFRDISLDAVGAIVFALAPAIMSVPSHVFRYFHTYRLMQNHPSLRVATQSFRYVRYGRKCGSDRNAENWGKSWDGVCTKKHCEVRMFLRCLPEPTTRYCNSMLPTIFSQVRQYCRNRYHKPKSNNSLSNDVPINPTLQWYGYRKRHTKNFVELQDVDEGITSWWWEAVSSANILVAKPLTVHVSNEKRMVNALALISDIISIGDLVLEYRLPFLQHQLKTNKGVQSSVTATPGITCNLIMEKVGLNNWFPIEAEVLESKEYEYPQDRKKYGMLFLILAEKSNMFSDRKSQSEEQCPLGDRCQLQEQECDGLLQKRRIPRLSQGEPQRISGQYILDELIRHGEIDHDLFICLAEKLVDKWLIDWGCRESTLLEPLPEEVVPRPTVARRRRSI